MINFDIKRGDIFYIYKYPYQIGSEQDSGRPAIIVSNNQCNRSSEVVEVVYCTTQPKADLPTHVKILSARKESTALCEQITSIDKSRIGDFVGTCNTQEMKEIDEALTISLGIATRTNEQVECTVDEKDADKQEKMAKLKAQRDIYKQMYEDLIGRILVK